MISGDDPLDVRPADMQAAAELAVGHIAQFMSAQAAVMRAVTSLLDVVQELAQGLAAGQKPECAWSDIVADTFEKHRRELRGEEVEWTDESESDESEATE